MNEDKIQISRLTNFKFFSSSLINSSTCTRISASTSIRFSSLISSVSCFCIKLSLSSRFAHTPVRTTDVKVTWLFYVMTFISFTIPHGSTPESWHIPPEQGVMESLQLPIQQVSSLRNTRKVLCTIGIGQRRIVFERLQFLNLNSILFFVLFIHLFIYLVSWFLEFFLNRFSCQV